MDCARRFTTYEHVQMRSMLVVKRDGRREEFQRDKLFSSLTKACAKRPLPVGSIEKVIDEIEGHLVESGRAEMTSRAIGGLVMDKLNILDRVAYIRFASVYLDFRDIESFREAIENLLESREQADGIHPDQLPMELADDDVAPVKRGRRGRASKRPQTNPA